MRAAVIVLIAKCHVVTMRSSYSMSVKCRQRKYMNKIFCEAVKNRGSILSHI